MNGYDALSESALAAHQKAIPTAQPATASQIRPRQTLTPISEAISASDLEKLLVLLHNLEDEPGMMREAPLTAQRRNDLPDSAFALPGRRYPIDTEDRARAALARVVANGTPSEISRVRAAVRRRYPNMNVEGDSED